MTNIVEIPLTRGYVAFIDAEDQALVEPYSWYATEDTRRTIYARASYYGLDGKKRGIRMHRLIMNAPSGVQVDHWDHNGCHNWKSNLRFGTHAQNKANTKPYRTGKASGYKGVYKYGNALLWFAAITCFRKQHKLGMYEHEDEAARAYDRAALYVFGEFAFTNFPRIDYLDLLVVRRNFWPLLFPQYRFPMGIELPSNSW